MSDKSKISKVLMSTTALATVMLAVGSLAGAQNAFAQEQDSNIETVVVTGSHIERNGYSAPTPVTVMSADQLEQAATITLADTVNRMPAFSGSRTPSSDASDVSQGGVGLNNLNLRGLGANRTLVLMDGQRLVGSSFDNKRSNGGSVDVNVIPSGLVSRVDVVTGGASAAYGSDALAGVVNFVLNHNYTGIKGQLEGGISTYGDDASYKSELTAGIASADGRWHLVVDGGASGSGEVYGNARPWTRQPGTVIVQNPAYKAGNGQPQNLMANNVGDSTGAPGGVITTAGPLAQTAFGANGIPYQLQGTVSGMYLIGGSWQDTRSGITPDLLASTTLGNAFSRLSYNLDDTTEIFVQFQWADSRAYEKYGLPANYLADLTVSSGEPFIPASIQAQMTKLGYKSITIGLVNGGPQGSSDVQGVGINDNRIFTRFAGGADGELDMMGSTWKWDVGYEHSGMNITAKSLNDTISANLQQAINSVVGPNGQIVCSNPSGGCVPFDPFGTNVNSPAAIAYISGTGHELEQLTQDAVDLDMTGNPFSIWAGQVSLAFGADWRQEAATVTSSALDQAVAFDYGNFLPAHGVYSVEEGYLETVIPLATNLSWAESADINASVRATNYSTSGYVTTWKVGADYQPIDDIKFRITRSQDIRAPTLAELFAGGSYNRGTIIDDFNGFSQHTQLGETVGNPKLLPEVAETTGFGAVLTPTFLPGFGASVDYFNISIGGAITSLSTQQEIDACYGLPGSNPALCLPGSVTVVNGVVTNTVNEPVNAVSQKENGLDIEASYDFPVSDIMADWDGDLAFRFLGTRTFEDNTVTLGVLSKAAGSPGGVSAYRYNLSASYTLDPISAVLTARGTSAGVSAKNDVQCTSGCPLSTTANPTIDQDYVPANTVFDIALNYKVFKDSDDLDLYLNIDNLANLNPPNLPGTYIGSPAASAYDEIGRMFRAGVRFKM